jgi:transposase
MTSSPSDALLEQLLARVEKLETALAAKDARIAELEAENAALKRRNAELERRLGLDSANSSQPPSTDKPWTKPAPRSLRKPSGKRPGKQEGDPGTTLAQTAEADHVVDHYPPTCTGCQEPLKAARPAGARRCQVFDLPQPAGLEVTEHRYHRLRCACGHTTGADPLPGATAPTCYGPRLSAAGAYLMSAHHLPVVRAAEILTDLCGAPVSTGWLAALAGRAHQRLGKFEDALKAAIASAPVAHADETGARVAGAGHWVHVAGTDTLTFLGVHPKRGREAMDTFGVLPVFSGTLVTDALASYNAYGRAHQLCCAHLLRELNALVDFEPDHKAWAKNMAQVLLEARDQVAAAKEQGRRSLTSSELAGIYGRYTRVIAFAKSGPPHALVRRLDERRADYLRFAVDFAVPFTSNAAERDVRMVKVQVKVSGGWRTLVGAQRFCRIRSFISTARKQGQRVLERLTEVFAGNVWLPATS